IAARAAIMVAVPTSNIWTMCGAWPARNAAIAATIVSGYWPLKVAFTWYWLWLALKSAAICSSRGPAGGFSPCQKSTDTRSAAAGVAASRRRSPRTEPPSRMPRRPLIAVSLPGRPAASRGRVHHRSAAVGGHARCAPSRRGPLRRPGPPRRAGRPRSASRLAEPEPLPDRRVVRLELRLHAPRAPPEQRAHPLGHRGGAVEPEARPGSEPGPPEQHVLQGHGELGLDRPLHLCRDLEPVLAEALRPVRQAPCQVEDRPRPAAVRGHQHLHLLGVQARAAHRLGHVQEDARLRRRDLVVAAVERDPRGLARAAAPEQADDVPTHVLG